MRTLRGGVTLIEERVAEVTVKVVFPEIAFKAAVTTLVPLVTAVARPILPAVLLTVATPVVADVQLTWEVKSWVVLSENVPVAMRRTVVPFAMDGDAGVTAMDARLAAVTIRVAEPLMPLLVAVIVELPALTPVATPVEAIVAFDVAEEVQLATDVKS